MCILIAYNLLHCHLPHRMYLLRLWILFYLMCRISNSHWIFVHYLTNFLYELNELNSSSPLCSNRMFIAHWVGLLYPLVCTSKQCHQGWGRIGMHYELFIWCLAIAHWQSWWVVNILFRSQFAHSQAHRQTSCLWNNCTFHSMILMLWFSMVCQWGSSMQFSALPISSPYTKI